MTSGKKQVTIPIYLQELVEDRPSGRLKLLAAWDDLTTETQIRIIYLLCKLYEEHSVFHRWLPNELKSKVLSTKNDYVQSLLIKHLCFHNEDIEDKKILSVLSESKNPLVRYTSKDYYSLDDITKEPKAFFSMSLEEQLACITCVSCGHGEGKYFVGLLEWALENSASNEKNLAQLTEEYLRNLKNDYLNSTKISRHYYVSEEPFLDDTSAFFDFIEKYSQYNDLCRAIIFYTPISEPLLRCSVNKLKDIVLKLNKKHLEIFLAYRGNISDIDTVHLLDLRKQILLSSNGEFSSKIRAAAIINSLIITPEEMHKLETEKNEEILEAISYMPNIPKNMSIGMFERLYGNDYDKAYNEDFLESLNVTEEEKINSMKEKIDYLHEKIKLFSHCLKWGTIGLFSLIIVGDIIHYIAKLF